MTVIARTVTGDEQALASSFKTRRVIGTAVMIIVALFFIVVALWSVTRMRGGTLGFDNAPSGELLATLADTSRLTSSAVEPSTHIDADGTTADTSTREYRVPAIAPIRAAIARACTSQGLSAAGPDDRRLMPDLVCQGRWRGRDATVHLNGRCDGACIATLEVRILRGDVHGPARGSPPYRDRVAPRQLHAAMRLAGLPCRRRVISYEGGEQI